MTKSRSNPFSSRFVQPGAIEYEFFGRCDIESLAGRFLDLHSRRGMIVGPHGSGKSTLVESLTKRIQLNDPDVPIVQQRLTRERGSKRCQRVGTHQWKRESIIILDGFEQVSLWSQLRIHTAVLRKRIRLLVTVHKPIRMFDLLWQTKIDDHAAEWLAQRLLGLSDQPEFEIQLQSLLSSEAWSLSRLRHGQNIRETLFDMYDWWRDNH